jgi:hypothetical protein
MTWAERVGDVATRLALVILRLLQIITELLRLLFVTLDRFVVDLGELTEGGLRRTEVAERAWVRLPGSVLLGFAYAILQFLAIFMVLFRQAATKVNDFIVGLAEGEERITGAPPAPPAPPTPPAPPAAVPPPPPPPAV